MEDLATGRMSVAQIAQRVRHRAATTQGPSAVHDLALVKRLLSEASAQGDKGRASVTVGGGGGGYRATGFQQWTLPFGAPSAANWIGMMAQRHMHCFGTTREQLAQVALNGRANAARNPKADND